MGIFSTTPRTKNEQAVYDKEKANALKLYNKAQDSARLDKVRAQARQDALPRTEQAKQRLTTGFGKLKVGLGKVQHAANKYAAWDAKMEKRQAQEGGGLIQQSMRADLKKKK